MAVPRPVLLAVLALALVSCVFLVTRSGSNESVTQAARAGGQPVSTAPAPPAGKTHTAPTAPKRQVGKVAVARRPSSDVPAEVDRAAVALGQDKVVVLFFTRPGAADDAATQQSVRSLHGLRGVAVLHASFNLIAAYRPMLSG